MKKAQRKFRKFSILSTKVWKICDRSKYFIGILRQIVNYRVNSFSYRSLPYKTSPTSSTTAALVPGDALAACASARYQCAPEEILYIGDDCNDLTCMEVCGISACPSDAHPAVRRQADYVCAARGGEGAVREVLDLLFDAKKAASSPAAT